MQPHAENKEDNLLLTYMAGRSKVSPFLFIFFLLPSNSSQFNIVKIGHVYDPKEQKLEVG